MEIKKNLNLSKPITCLDDIGPGDLFIYEKEADADIYMKIRNNGVLSEDYNIIELGTGILFKDHSKGEIFPLTKVEIKGVIENGG